MENTTVFDCGRKESRKNGSGGLMKILVTGGAGFIGSHVTDALIMQGKEVVIVDDLSSPGSLHIHPSAVFYRADIGSPLLEEVFAAEKPDAVIHLAAQIDVQASLADPQRDARINIAGTLSLLQCCVRHGVAKIVYASSAAVYGVPQYLGIDENHPANPVSFYGVSKLTPEYYIRCYAALYGIRYTILRYANVYGPRQDPRGEAGVVAIFADKLLRGVSPLIYGDGDQTRDFVYVRDVAAANILALSRGDGEIFNIGSGRSTSVNRLAELIRRLAGTSDAAPVHEAARAGDIRHSFLEPNKACLLLGWEADTALTDGVRELLEHCRGKKDDPVDDPVETEIKKKVVGAYE